MKIEYNKDVNASSGGVNVIEMSIDTTRKAKLFKILSHSLYKDSVTSIIRELCSNAYDSHLMAKALNTPFDITIPTWSNMFFVIRDYGLGLNQEDGEKTIFSYLGSSKDEIESTNIIGGWGLGSKSPYAYTSNFEVTLYKEGYFWQYNCWQDANGIPQHAVFSEGPTEEPNGVMMKVPVQASDLYTFKNACVKYLTNTDFNINVTNSTEYPIYKKEAKFSFERNGYKFKLTNHRTSGEFLMLYGGFIYEVNGLNGIEAETQRILNEFKEISAYSILIDVQVGDCEFSVSRESLINSEQTLNFINGAIDALTEYLNEEAIAYNQQVVDAINTELAACQSRGELINFSKINEVHQKYSVNKPIFTYLNYGQFIKKLASVNLKIALGINRDAVEGQKKKSANDLFNLEVTLNQFKLKMSNGKEFDSEKHLCRIKTSSSYRNYSRKYKANISQHVLNKIKINVLSPIRGQFKFVWNEGKTYAKYITPTTDTNSGMFLIQCPTHAEAVNIINKMGLYGIEIEHLSEHFKIIPVESRKQMRHNKPIKVTCMTTSTIYEYQEDHEFFYVKEGEAWNSALQYYFKNHNIFVFQASPAFVKRFGNGKIDNVHHISEILDYVDLDDMINKYKKRYICNNMNNFIKFFNDYKKNKNMQLIVKLLDIEEECREYTNSKLSYSDYSQVLVVIKTLKPDYTGELVIKNKVDKYNSKLTRLANSDIRLLNMDLVMELQDVSKIEQIISSMLPKPVVQQNKYPTIKLQLIA